ncbi:hypothetical protein [Agromyces bauzanensis]|uniref:Uncharacterized protein n=1 Tax=Agromyces bauzanensis TaxID=1308924 RepID=A0A917PWE8_9MICO|nr:hypothetical protein [Agromyces bauzanensis]GGJ94808.1 hypothetical protein GCM10011372_36360 [Agromyces bauzanensis]
MASEPRTRTARARAEEALVRFALLTGEHTTEFVVIGGLNPDFLAPTAPHPHLGTTDVDLLFELGFVYDRDELDFGWLDRALVAGGFTAVGTAAGWQWTGVLGDALVRLDLLCDVYDSPGQPIHLPGAAEATAQNLIGPAAALHNPVERELDVPDTVIADMPEAPDHVRLRFASLGGYIAAKSAAFMSREKGKDAYDLAFVIMYGSGGPRTAASASAATEVPPYREPIAATITSAVTRLADAESPWIDIVVQELHLAGDESDDDQLRTDILRSAAQFLASYTQLRD